MRITLLFLVFFSFCFSLSAQKGNSSLQIGIGMSGTSYIGDLTENETAFSRVYPGGGLTVQFNGDAIVQPYLATGFGYFTEQSDQLQFEPMPNLEPNTFVETSFFYADLRLKARLFPKKRIQPYISTGVGLTFFSPKDEEGNFLGENIFTRLEGEEYNTTIASFPVTAGIQGRLNRRLGIGLDYTYRITPTDYLDNIGELGGRDGNDALHGLQFTLYFMLEPPKDIPDEIPETGQDSVLASIDNPSKSKNKNEKLSDAEKLVSSSLEPLAESTREMKENAENALRTTLAILAESEGSKPVEVDTQVVAVAPPPTAEVAVVTPDTEPKVITPPKEVTPKPAPVVDDGIDWLAREKAALENRDFIYYPVKSSDELNAIISRFKVRKETVKTINHMVNDEVYAGSYLRLPNVGIPVE